MYFRSNALRKTWLEKCLKSPPFDRQHGKWLETLLQSERMNLYHIY